MSDVMEGVRGVVEPGAAAAAAGGAVAEGTESDRDSSASGRPKKKQRVADESLEVFRQVMSEFAPAQPRHLPADPDAFFKAIGLSDDQREAVAGQLPAAAGGASFPLLAGFDKEMLHALGLSKVQVNAWVNLIAKIL